MNPTDLPTRVRVLVLGGGIHGVGVLHDLASRGWTDVHLIEKSTLGAGTSSRSTKLIHGGLRYLQQIRDFGLVMEALKERHHLINLAPDLVYPVEFLFPILKGEGLPRYMIKMGLMLYDFLAGKYGLDRHRLVVEPEVSEKVPLLDTSLVKAVYSYWDGQTDDLGLVKRVAASARKLGAGISEGHRVKSIKGDEDGWLVEIETPTGEIKRVSALYVVNATGPWANRLLEASSIQPTHRAINNKGVHLLLPDLGLKAGLFLQSPADKRIFFVLPWLNYTLIGTTEEYFGDDPDDLRVREDEVSYLLERCNKYLNRDLTENDVIDTFAGLRWLAVDSDRGLTDTSRAHAVGEKPGKRGSIYTIYGGKLTTYRTLAKSIGDRITQQFGEFKPSQTHLPECWAEKDDVKDLLPVSERFADI